ncbi:hypothetical protein SDC9_166635 [bioreactor metagenome]|uniref:Uncharacterized protein n=1 Tax=bioreactor metagenome TaxID=1076179 RepID=A0A645FXK6_9ZZZZ
MLSNLFPCGSTPSIPLLVLTPVERAVPAAEEQVIYELAEYVVDIPITGNFVNESASFATSPFWADR